jgi:hypothetical protein
MVGTGRFETAASWVYWVEEEGWVRVRVDKEYQEEVACSALINMSNETIESE